MFVDVDLVIMYFIDKLQLSLEIDMLRRYIQIRFIMQEILLHTIKETRKIGDNQPIFNQTSTSSIIMRAFRHLVTICLFLSLFITFEISNNYYILYEKLNR